MNTSRYQDVMLAALAEAGYHLGAPSAEDVEAVSFALSEAPPCELSYRAAELACRAMGEQSVPFDIWHDIQRRDNHGLCACLKASS